MPVQIQINPETGLTKCGNNNKKEDTCQLLFSEVHSAGVNGYAFGIPNILRNAEQLISKSMTKDDSRMKDVCYDPHAYWSVDHRPKGTKQIVDSGLFTFLYGGSKNAPLKEVERYCDYYIEFVNHHFEKHCFTENTPWFVELDLHGRFPLEDYHRIQKKLLDKCPNRDFIGVWHDEWGMKQLEDVCEKFDYVSLSLAGGWNWDIVFGVMSFIHKKYPGKCVHLLGTSDVPSLCWGGLMKACDSMDCTGWSRSKRYGLHPCPGRERGPFVKPAEMFCNEHILAKFPRKFIKEKIDAGLKDPVSGWTLPNRESGLWSLCQVWSEWQRAQLYGHQYKWDECYFGPAMRKILSGKGAELTEADLGKPLYDTEWVQGLCKYDFWMPVDTEKGWHYKDKFKTAEDFNKGM